MNVTEVKSQGGGRSDRRRERSRRTRRAIVGAATELFAARGYATTTMAAIADRAGVAVQTVYATYGTKRTILGDALDQAIAGDDAAVAVNDRDWMSPVWTAPTAADRLVAYAAAVRRIMAGAGDMLVVISRAAGGDPDLADLAATAERRRRAGAVAVVDSVAEVGPLRRGLDRDDAVDVLWLLNSPAVFHHLVREAGWTLDRYEQWLGAAMVRELLER